MKKHKLSRWFDKFSNKVTHYAGNPFTFFIALCIVIIWAFCGPVSGYSNTWQLIINTGTTIITFLMVFIIQQSQNKDSTALHLKLNELIAATSKASNFLIAIEDLTPEELEVIRNYYEKIVELSKEKGHFKEIHSEEQAIKLVEEKLRSKLQK